MSVLTKRPILRYFGGKWKLAPWIISHFPAHRVYVEPYGGGANVLLRKTESYAEVYNDLDGEVVNLFRVTRDHGQRLRHALINTPYSRAEFYQSYERTGDMIEDARRMVVRSFMGFGADGATGQYRTGFRGTSARGGGLPCHNWRDYADNFERIVQRLRAVIIENRDALEVMDAHDTEQTLHYVDPPYVMETRADIRHGYRHEMTDDDHQKLADFLNGLRGMVIVSGYNCPIYERAFKDWRRVDSKAYDDNAAARTESIWISPRVPSNQLF